MDGEVVLVGSRECGRLWGWPVADWCALTTWTYNSGDDTTYFSSYLYLDHTRDSVPGSGADVTNCWSPGRSMYTRSNPESPFSQPRWANWLPSVNKLQKQSESFYFIRHYTGKYCSAVLSTSFPFFSRSPPFRLVSRMPRIKIRRFLHVLALMFVITAHALAAEYNQKLWNV